VEGVVARVAFVVCSDVCVLFGLIFQLDDLCSMWYDDELFFMVSMLVEMCLNLDSRI
jgi:hypothetical protein